MFVKDLVLLFYDELKKMGIYKCKDFNGYFVVYKVFCDDFEVNLFKMFFGKIEIYFSRLVEIVCIWELEKDEVISLLLVYVLTFEGWNFFECRIFLL